MNRLAELRKVMETEEVCRLAAIAAPPSPEVEFAQAMEYINLAKMSKDGDAQAQVSQAEIDALYNCIKQTVSVRATDEHDLALRLQRLDGRWPIHTRRMLQNRGYYKFVRDNGSDSDFMLEFYFDVPGFVKSGDLVPRGMKPNWSFIMDTAYGHYKASNGVYQKIPQADQATRQVIYEATWGGVRFRGANYALERILLGGGANMVTLGAGTLPEMRFFDWQNRGIKQNVTAYDSNPLVKSALPILFEKPIKEYGVNYYHEDMVKAFRNPDLENSADMVMIQGVMSYNRALTASILVGAKRLLRAGGFICFDVQLAEIGLAKCRDVLHWNIPGLEMLPDESANSAVERIEQAANEAGLRIAEVLDDSEFSFAPTTVWFKLAQ